MLPLTIFLLDLPGYLLLKLRKNRNVSFFFAKTSGKGGDRCHFEYGESDTSLQKLTFLQCQTVLNPHSERNRG